MDILHLIDRLEELFNESRALPFTHNVIVDEDKMLDIIDQMRITIPEEVKKAKQLLNQSERIIAQAEEKANRLTAIAQEKADEMTSEDIIAQEATRRADAILTQARADAEATRADADDYVIETLARLETDLGRLLNQVQNGIQAVSTSKKS
jgi:cell division septum initiation protein DivIVA